MVQSVQKNVRSWSPNTYSPCLGITVNSQFNLKKKLITTIYVQVQDNADTAMSTVCVITWQQTEDLMNIRQFN